MTLFVFIQTSRKEIARDFYSFQLSQQHGLFSFRAHNCPLIFFYFCKALPYSKVKSPKTKKNDITIPTLHLFFACKFFKRLQIVRMKMRPSLFFLKKSTQEIHIHSLAEIRNYWYRKTHFFSLQNSHATRARLCSPEIRKNYACSAG